MRGAAKNLKDFDIKNLDFVFGGSTLNLLGCAKAERAGDETRYACEAIDLGGAKPLVMISKMNNYISDFNQVGFQFERVLGANAGAGAGSPQEFSEACAARQGAGKHEHLQVVEVGYEGSAETDDHYGATDEWPAQKWSVLIPGDADAVEKCAKTGALSTVEIKAGNPKNFKMKVMWQMVSNGSQSLIMAEKEAAKGKGKGKNAAGPRLLQARHRTLDDMVKGHSRDAIASAEWNIVQCMAKMREWQEGGELRVGQRYELRFDGAGSGVDNMMLVPLQGYVAEAMTQLPSAAILKELGIGAE